MVVLNQCNSDNPRMYDLSFMYTKRCNLACSFCMYNSGPAATRTLNLGALRTWLGTVDMDRIASFGAYGGEPSVDLEGWSAIFEMLPQGKPHFVITNGSWSRSKEQTQRFLDWCARWRMFIVVSGTEEHRRFQDRRLLESLAAWQPKAFRLKPLEENFHAMGRLAGKIPFDCSHKCMSWNRARRVAVEPEGTLIFQNCDGEYPTVGTLEEAFPVIDTRIQQYRNEGFGAACRHFGGSWIPVNNLQGVSSVEL